MRACFRTDNGMEVVLLKDYSTEAYRMMFQVIYGEMNILTECWDPKTPVPGNTFLNEHENKTGNFYNFVFFSSL